MIEDAAVKGTLRGTVRYFQDFRYWEREFPSDLVFTLRENRWSKGSFLLVAPGYGERGNYGNGAISLLPGEFERAWRSIGPATLEYSPP